jgi:AraC-like DNA-binding protein
MSSHASAGGANIAIMHFVSWEGGALFISRGSAIVPTHAHYAIQVGFGSEPGIGFRTSEREPWTHYDGAVIASRQPHSMDTTRPACNAVLFVEPETREGRILTERFGAEGISALPAEVVAQVAPPLFSAWLERGTVEAVVDAARQAVVTITGGVMPAVASDERILRAIAYILRRLDGPLTLEEVAQEAFLSPSRFRHLFVEQTGMALRPYILWRRFLRVWELLTAGESLSTAAHEAGFADAAHLSRTSRSMFGFPPSAMQMAGPLGER